MYLFYLSIFIHATLYFVLTTTVCFLLRYN